MLKLKITTLELNWEKLSKSHILKFLRKLIPPNGPRLMLKKYPQEFIVIVEDLETAETIFSKLSSLKFRETVYFKYNKFRVFKMYFDDIEQPQDYFKSQVEFTPYSLFYNVVQYSKKIQEEKMECTRAKPKKDASGDIFTYYDASLSKICPHFPAK